MELVELSVRNGKKKRMKKRKLRSEAKTCNAQTIGLNQNPRNGGDQKPGKNKTGTVSAASSAYPRKKLEE